jgi:hypothetical protein
MTTAEDAEKGVPTEPKRHARASFQRTEDDDDRNALNSLSKFTLFETRS